MGSLFYFTEKLPQTFIFVFTEVIKFKIYHKVYSGT